jgi:hypothetical protein
MATTGTVHEVGGMKCLVAERIGWGATSDVVKAFVSDRRVVVLKVYRVFQKDEIVAMSDIVSEESRIMTEWNHPCIVKGLGMKRPQTFRSNAILAMEFMEQGSIVAWDRFHQCKRF